MTNTSAKMHRTPLLGIVTLLVLCLSGADARSVHPAQHPHTAVPGGANQVQGVRGKVGDILFDGHWRFQVVSVQKVRTYELTVAGSEQDFSRYTNVADFDEDTHTFTAKDGYTFVAVKCRARNGQHQTENLDAYSDDPKTAVTDAKANSYPPFAYDMTSSGAWITKDLLPGSEEDLTVLFAVPQDFQPKDLVFTLKNYADSAGRNVRVTLG